MNETQLETARRLGYGDDVDAMNLDHDPLHRSLAEWLSLPEGSYALAQAAGHPVDHRLAGLEEDAVLALQAFCVAAKRWPRDFHGQGLTAARDFATLAAPTKQERLMGIVTTIIAIIFGFAAVAALINSAYHAGRSDGLKRATEIVIEHREKIIADSLAAITGAHERSQ